MPSTLHDSASVGHLERLADLRPRMAKAVKKLETPWRARVGKAIDRALGLAGTTQKEAWVLLGHKEGSQLNRWISGEERPQFDVLFAVEEFRQPLVIALAELAGDVEIETVVRVKRKRVA